MKTESTVILYLDRNAAVDRARWMTRAGREIYCVIDGPEDNFAVVDIRTAIELGVNYSWFA